MREDVHNSDIPVLCRACEARHHGVCGALNPDQLLALAKQTTQKEVSAGSELIATGEPITNYASIMSGVVKLPNYCRMAGARLSDFNSPRIFSAGRLRKKAR